MCSFAVTCDGINGNDASLHVVASGHRQTTALKLIVIDVAEIQDQGRR